MDGYSREELLYYSERWASSGRMDDIWEKTGQKSGGKVAERNFNKLSPRTADSSVRRNYLGLMNASVTRLILPST